MAGAVKKAGHVPIYDDLHAQIVDGKLPPGSALIEGALATEYSTSRTPVREALSRLVHEGLVVRHDRGLKVRVLRPEDVLEVYEVRIALEAAAARAAAARRTDLDLGRLRHVVELMQQLAGDRTGERANLGHSFHFIIWEASHNQVLVETLRSVHRRVLGLASTTLHYPERWAVFVDEAERIVDAIADQDGARASEVAAAQMTNARDFRIRLYSSTADDAQNFV